MRIGVFDSGIGGLTVLKKLVDKFPNNQYIYFGDTKNVPYGNKNKEELKELSCKIIDFLIKKEVDMIIIACGTISSNLSVYLKQKYSNINIIDIISPVINYLNNSNYNKIGIIATQATINSKIFSSNIKKDIKEVACPMFVPMIETNNLIELNKYFDIYLNSLKDCEIIVLGCTHYPIIKQQIKRYLNNNTRLLDMSECICDITNDGVGSIDLYFTDLNDNIIINSKTIMEDKINSINLI